MRATDAVHQPVSLCPGHPAQCATRPPGRCRRVACRASRRTEPRSTQSQRHAAGPRVLSSRRPHQRLRVEAACTRGQPYRRVVALCSCRDVVAQASRRAIAGCRAGATPPPAPHPRSWRAACFGGSPPSAGSGVGQHARKAPQARLVSSGLASFSPQVPRARHLRDRGVRGARCRPPSDAPGVPRTIRPADATSAVDRRNSRIAQGRATAEPAARPPAQPVEEVRGLWRPRDDRRSYLVRSHPVFNEVGWTGQVRLALGGGGGNGTSPSPVREVDQAPAALVTGAGQLTAKKSASPQAARRRSSWTTCCHHPVLSPSAEPKKPTPSRPRVRTARRHRRRRLGAPVEPEYR